MQHPIRDSRFNYSDLFWHDLAYNASAFLVDCKTVFLMIAVRPSQ